MTNTSTWLDELEPLLLANREILEGAAVGVRRVDRLRVLLELAENPRIGDEIDLHGAVDEVVSNLRMVQEECCKREVLAHQLLEMLYDGRLRRRTLAAKLCNEAAQRFHDTFDDEMARVQRNTLEEWRKKVGVDFGTSHRTGEYETDVAQQILDKHFNALERVCSKYVESPIREMNEFLVASSEELANHANKNGWLTQSTGDRWNVEETIEFAVSMVVKRTVSMVRDILMRRLRAAENRTAVETNEQANRHNDEDGFRSFEAMHATGLLKERIAFNLVGSLQTEPLPLPETATDDPRSFLEIILCSSLDLLLPPESLFLDGLERASGVGKGLEPLLGGPRL